MINGLEGIPGSGKSYEAVVHHVVEYLKAGYMVITNLPLLVDQFAAIDPKYRELIVLRTRPQPIRGTWNANRVDENGKGEAFELFSDGHTEDPPASATAFGGVWDYYTTWKHPKTGQGPKFIIDECHVPLPAIGTASAVVEYFKLHRHFNVDVLLGTQSFRDVNQPIARLLGMLIKVRKADILGRADHYIRKVHGGYRGAVISTEERKYKPQYFALYKSHTQGNSVAESLATDVKPFLVKFKRLTYGVWFVVLVGAIIFLWPKDKAEKALPFKTLPPYTTQEREEQRIQAAVKAAVKHVDHPQAAELVREANPASVPVEVVVLDPDPFSGKKLHLTGWLRFAGRDMYTFTVSDGGRRIFDLQLDEIQRAGYRFKALGHCSGVLVYGNTPRPVTCDAPIEGVGSSSTPKVIEAGKGVPTNVAPS